MSIRIERANSTIQAHLSQIIHNRMNDPRLDSLMYISQVQVTPDFKYCKVKLAMDIEPEKANQIVSTLQKSEGYIKRELASKVKMPQVPHLVFELDKGTAAQVRVNELLKNLNIPKDEGNE